MMRDTASLLIEALPYIRHFSGKTIVIKYGGHAMKDEALKESFAKDVVLMKYIGIHPVVVHGGGPQIGRMLDRVGKKSDFRAGMRVTDQDTMDVVEMVLAGKVNKEIVAFINRHGGRAIGLSGKDGQLIEARKMHIYRYQGDDQPPEIIDIGLVGEVQRINAEILKVLEQSRVIPVIAPVGVGTDGETYNINADLVAGKVASALNAEKLILMTDVPGVLDRSGELISTMTASEAADLMQDETLKGGMIPKVQCAIDAVQAGVHKVAIVDGRIPHCVLLELFTDSGIGTEIVGTRTRRGGRERTHA
ncbi:N-acetylglutamate kinase [Desulfacinum hydrothermale DSM 13146]|uniref:Acetylglutamate kinase n=1 Tax=Desulfacinum hydrothermale DSM 13146 TaxID=1121390 RepID=A0A1W1X8C6_9BACT|nr:acetylglutamate kinase [Desulfacinum hydrothermale]SMC20123.1 N-acetylglutamate kinase [Desulfacinum hydrothermale DSM 13146]